MSSWAAETYPWFVIVNWPVLSNELVPTTQYDRTIVDLGCRN